MPRVKSFEAFIDKNKRIAGKIAEYQKLTGYKSSKIAAYARMSQATFYNRMKDPSKFRVDEINRIAAVLHIPMDELRQYV